MVAIWRPARRGGSTPTRPLFRQHQVDYRPFKKNRLIKMKGIEILKGVNNYGMKLVKKNPAEAGQEFEWMTLSLAWKHQYKVLIDTINRAVLQKEPRHALSWKVSIRDSLTRQFNRSRAFVAICTEQLRNVICNVQAPRLKRLVIASVASKLVTCNRINQPICSGFFSKLPYSFGIDHARQVLIHFVPSFQKTGSVMAAFLSRETGDANLEPVLYKRNPLTLDKGNYITYWHK